jgi:hypothetical protein
VNSNISGLWQITEVSVPRDGFSAEVLRVEFSLACDATADIHEPVETGEVT